MAACRLLDPAEEQVGKDRLSLLGSLGACLQGCDVVIQESIFFNLQWLAIKCFVIRVCSQQLG